MRVTVVFNLDDYDDCDCQNVDVQSDQSWSSFCCLLAKWFDVIIIMKLLKVYVDGHDDLEANNKLLA